MSNLWAGLKNAKVSERGEFFGEGSFDLEIIRLQPKVSARGKGLLFIAEFRVLQTSNPEDPFDSQRVWIVKMANQASWGNIKGLFIAAFGRHHADDKHWCETVLDPVIESITDRLTGPENPLAGVYVHLETNIGEVKATGQPFTYHNWSAFDYEGNVCSPRTLDHLLVPQRAQTYPDPVGPIHGPQQGYPYVPPPVSYGAAYIPAPPTQYSPDGRYWLNTQTNQWVAV